MTKKTLVLGASLKTNRYSNMVLHRLMDNDISTNAYGLKSGIIAGVSIDTELTDYAAIHTITLYLNPKRQQEFYKYIISLQPKRVIFNPGTENPELMLLLENHQITYEVACTLTLLAIGQY